jgi:translation elongation factor EF-4
MNLMGCIMRLYLTLPKAATYTSLELYADSEIIPVKKTFNILHEDTEESVAVYSNRLKIGLENFTTTSANQEVLVWAVFPTMNESTKTLKAVVKDSQGYVYVGDVTRVNMKDGSYNFYMATKRSSAYRLNASPVLTDGFQGGIEDWINDGNDYGGVAN